MTASCRDPTGSLPMRAQSDNGFPLRPNASVRTGFSEFSGDGGCASTTAHRKGAHLRALLDLCRVAWSLMNMDKWAAVGPVRPGTSARRAGGGLVCRALKTVLTIASITLSAPCLRLPWRLRDVPPAPLPDESRVANSIVSNRDRAVRTVVSSGARTRLRHAYSVHDRAVAPFVCEKKKRPRLARRSLLALTITRRCGLELPSRAVWRCAACRR
jgi:hypothetical protein